MRAALGRVAAGLGAPDAEIVLERPRDPAHGDFATNLALQLAKPLKKKPRDVADLILKELSLPAGIVDKTEIAGPGFINFRLATGALSNVLEAVLTQGTAYGRSNLGAGKKANVEFVSANPTGPLHVGHGRQAVLGDAIASLLEVTGWTVTREFYYNDAGVQMAKLGASVLARLTGQPVPEGGYHGEYISDIATRYSASAKGKTPDEAAVRAFATAELRKEQDADLRELGLKFDIYFLESSLYADGRVEKTVKGLTAGGHTFEEDGALWLRTTDFGDDKDRVMKKSEAKGGDFTYFVPDVAYHVTKWERGFARAINVQGSDHHGTVARVRAGLQALDAGIPKGYPEYVLHQMVTVMKGGEEMKISKRAGSYLTLRDLLDEVGRDAFRFFFLMRKADSHFVFDVDLAKKQSEENPVYYVQYAHTRLAGIFRNAGVDPAALPPYSLTALVEADEGEIMKHLGEYPGILARAGEVLEPHRIVTYLEDLARLVNGWYHRHRVIGVGEELERARLALARAAQIVLAGGLNLLGVSAPERM
ncbi:MAG TPA: arginine--tRNA ligase [Gemmatimonadales bacterium]